MPATRTPEGGHGHDPGPEHPAPDGWGGRVVRLEANLADLRLIEEHAFDHSLTTASSTLHRANILELIG